jgi:hypothetical protein
MQERITNIGTARKGECLSEQKVDQIDTGTRIKIKFTRYSNEGSGHEAVMRLQMQIRHST